jgi:hypothetical protein
MTLMYRKNIIVLLRSLFLIEVLESCDVSATSVLGLCLLALEILETCSLCESQKRQGAVIFVIGLRKEHSCKRVQFPILALVSSCS